MTAVILFIACIIDISTHTLTWSVTIYGCFKDVDTADFNSHAHVERDTAHHFCGTIKSISTHTLTWSVTGQYTGLTDTNGNISTHTLTWSVTAK